MKTRLFIPIFLLFYLAAIQGFSQNEALLRKKQFNIEKGIAISGFDPVSYFSGKPKKGEKEISYSYEGVTYRFISQGNMEAFKKNPEKYEPAYGGWCAYAMGESGEKVEIDPETFKIINGKLYLYYNKFFTNTLDKWNKNESVLKKQADANWVKTYK